ncbi:hypothetical protein D3C81_645640 [compost metagenome]
MNSVQIRLLNENSTSIDVECDWTLLEPRQRMVVWMHEYFDEVINKVNEGPVKESMLAAKNDYEIQLDHHKAIIEEFYNRSNVQELFKGDKIHFAKFLMSHTDSPRWYNWLLFKAHDFGGLDKVPTWVWREMTYKMKYIKYGRGGKPDSKTS